MSTILPFAVDCCDTDFCDSPVTVSVPGPKGDDGEDGSPGSGGTEGVFYADTLTDARAVPSDPTNLFLTMFGTDVKGNGFGATFWWDNTSSDLDDYTDTGGSTLTPTDSVGAGRWKRFS